MVLSNFVWGRGEGDLRTSLPLYHSLKGLIPEIRVIDFAVALLYYANFLYLLLLHEKLLLSTGCHLQDTGT